MPQTENYRQLYGSPKAAMDLFNSPAFSTRVQELMEEWHAPGLTAAVVHDQTILSKGWGKATSDPPRACTADTLFEIASSSKSLTAASVALLVEDDEKYPKVQWDSTMNSLLPEDFVMSKDEYTKNVTVEDILSHRTGLPGHDYALLSTRAKQPDNARSVTRNLRNLEITEPIRTKWIYNNIMYTVASYLVESLSGMAFSEFLHETFFKPLGMESTHLQPGAVIRAGLKDQMAFPHMWLKQSETYRQFEDIDQLEAQGAGGIYSSVNDYIKYIKAMIHKEGPITEKVYVGVTKPRMLTGDGDDDDDDLVAYYSPFLYAAGWETYWYHGVRVIRHDGSDAGFASMHYFLPDFKFGGVFLSNADGGGDVIVILMKELLDELLQVPKEQRIDWNARDRKQAEKWEEKTKQEKEELRQELCPDGPQPQKMPLDAYTGEYFNPGYRSMTVQVKDGNLFIDCMDRTFGGFTLTFEHARDSTQYLVHQLMTGDEDPMLIKGEFRFENDRVTRLGLQIEEDSDGLIWFDRVQG